MIKKFSIFITAILLFGCATVPLTGRKQLSIIPNSEILPLSFTSYKDVLKESKLSTNTKEVAQIKTVGNKIKTAVEQYMTQNKLADHLKGYDWEFNLIDDPATLNAWCMPGGKVAFYSGILPVCKDESGIAVVMGHEVAHAIANHGRERMSQGLIQQMGGLALSVAVANKPNETQTLYNTAYAIGSNYGAMLPFSRLHESEADKLGLIFMAMAGYDPHVAPQFWQRMQASTGGQAPPQWLSTHPSNENRIKALNEYMPKAMKYYKKSGQAPAGTLKAKFRKP